MYRDLSKPLNVEKEIKLYTGTGNHALAKRIADNLGLEISGLELSKFANGEVYARFDESVRGDEVCRMFVLPGYQGKGYGGELLRFAEKVIARSFGTARLDASLAAKGLYIKRNYMTIDFSRITAENGDYLCYDTMIKKL